MFRLLKPAFGREHGPTCTSRCPGVEVLDRLIRHSHRQRLCAVCHRIGYRHIQLCSLLFTTMSCCGSAKEPGIANSKPAPQHMGMVTAQPRGQPMMHQPAISPPPQVHPNTFNPGAQFQQQQNTGTQWTSGAPTPMNASEFGSFNTATTATAFNGSAYNPSTFNVQTGFASNTPSVMRTSSPAMSNMVSSTPMPQSRLSQSSPPDEGKMSVSIDFGEFSLFTQHVLYL